MTDQIKKPPSTVGFPNFFGPIVNDMRYRHQLLGPRGSQTVSTALSFRQQVHQQIDRFAVTMEKTAP